MERALPMDEYIPFDSSVEETGDISNMTAEQYLSWVRYQANELPDVFRANVDSTKYVGRQTKYMPNIQEVVVCPEDLLPSAEWERDVISAFSDLRSLLSRLSLTEASRERKLLVPQLKDENAWHKFCLGTECDLEEITDSDEKTGMDIDDATPNSFDIAQRKAELAMSLGISDIMDDGGTAAASRPNQNIESNDSDGDESHDATAGATAVGGGGGGVYPVWSGTEDALPTTSLLLQFDQVMTQRLLGYQVSWVEVRDSLSSARGQWLYGLLARLEKPLDRNVASLVRQLYRRCSHLRASLSAEASSFDLQIASLNVLIAITGSYFGQGEEYSTLTVGYGNEEEDEEDGEDDGDDEGYYYEGGEEEEEPLEGQYKIGDDIWNDRPDMAVESELSADVTYSHTLSGSDYSTHSKKRSAENFPEEGEEEDGEII